MNAPVCMCMNTKPSVCIRKKKTTLDTRSLDSSEVFRGMHAKFERRVEIFSFDGCSCG